MGTGERGERLARVRAELAAIGRELVDGGRSLTAEEMFQLAGEAQRVANAADGIVALSAAWGGRVETTMWESRPWERVHPVGYVDAMASTSLALEAGLTDGVAGRKVALGAALRERFPHVLDLVVTGEVPAHTAHKVVDACQGLAADACAEVDEAIAPRLSGLDPARVSAEARRLATRSAPEQVEAHLASRLRVRTVEVRPSEDGLTDWYALLPTDRSAAAWSAVESLAEEYRSLDDTLSVPESRADAFGDLLLRNVTVTARVTLGVPVLPDAPSAGLPAGERMRVEWDDDDTFTDACTGEQIRFGDLDEQAQEDFSWVEPPPETDDDLAVEMAVVNPGLAVGGTMLPGLGWVSPTTVAALFRSLPLEVARAVFEAGTGTLVSHTASAYRPPPAMREFVRVRDGTCRMWGCGRRAECTDLDHTRPWPDGGTSPGNLVSLCRRHHRMKQLGLWRPSLSEDGTLSWTSGAGTTRVTEPSHRIA